MPSFWRRGADAPPASDRATPPTDDGATALTPRRRYPTDSAVLPRPFPPQPRPRFPATAPPASPPPPFTPPSPPAPRAPSPPAPPPNAAPTWPHNGFHYPHTRTTPPGSRPRARPLP